MDIFGHHNFSATACQGQYLIAKQSEFTFERETMPTTQEKLDYALKVVSQLDKERRFAVAIAKTLKERAEKAVKILAPLN